MFKLISEVVRSMKMMAMTRHSAEKWVYLCSLRRNSGSGIVGTDVELKMDSHGAPYCSMRSHSRSAVSRMSYSSFTYTDKDYCNVS